MKQAKQIIQLWIRDVEDNGRSLTKWEDDFIESIGEQFADTGSLSDRQEEILERIRAEKTP